MNDWTAVTSLFDELMDAPAEERAQRISEMPDSREWVIAQVQSLLLAHDAADGRFDAPAVSRLNTEQRLALLPPEPVVPMQRVGAYQIVRKVGEGGMGAVYEAVRADDVYHKRVAIKTIARGAQSSVIAARFRRERQILAQLQHPNIASLIDGGVTESGTPYFVLEFVDGVAIDAWCTIHSATIAQRLDLVQQACRAVQHAHQHLVVHRDLKPANVLVDADGVVKLLDFGVARLVEASRNADGERDATITRDGASPMTVAYASPEQLRGDAVSTTSDVYSLGVMLYELLAGAPPFERSGQSAVALSQTVLNSDAVPPSERCSEAAARASGGGTRASLTRALRGELDAIVMMAMHKDASRRYHSAEALAADLRRFLRGQPVLAQPDSVGYRVRKYYARYRWPVLLATSLTIVAIASAVTIARQSLAARREGERSARVAEFLQGVLGAADASSLGGALPRIGPGASIGALLDSAARRVPLEFRDDPAVRARLYLTIGSSLVAQSRMREATPLLDSAIALSRSSYGASSEQFVLANLEAGRAALHRNNIARAYAMVDSASVALIRDGKRASELFARTLVDRASIAFVAGEYAIVQRDADGALAMETHRTAQPTMVKAIALNRLGSMAVVSGMLFRGDTLYRQSIDLMRAMHATQNLELLDVLSNAQSVARSLGQTARADSLMNSGVRIASETFGVDSREMALMLAGRVELELAHHDTGAATASSARAIRIVDSLPDVVLPVRIIARFSAVMLALARHDLRGASSTLDRIIAIAGNASRGAPLVQVLMVHCSILTSLGRYDAAHATCKRAVAVHDSSGMVMPYFRMTLHSEQARVYAHRGDWASVTRELASFTPQQDSAIRRYIAAELAANASRK